MRKILIPALIIAGLSIPTRSANAHKIELIVHPNSTLVAARNALKKGKLKKAIGLYKRALKRGASGVGAVWAYNDLCVAYYLQTDLDEAMGYCDKAIKMAPNQWIAYNNRGNILFSSGNIEGAAEAYQRALKLKPDSDIVKTNLVMVKDAKENNGQNTGPSPYKIKNKNQDFHISGYTVVAPD